MKKGIYFKVSYWINASPAELVIFIGDISAAGQVIGSIYLEYPLALFCTTPQGNQEQGEKSCWKVSSWHGPGMHTYI